MDAPVSVSAELMSRLLLHTKTVSEDQLAQNLRDSAREILRVIAVMRDVAEFDTNGSTATEYILPAAGREFCRIFEISGRLPENQEVRANYPEEWKNYFNISDDGQTGTWTPPPEVVSRLRELPYRLYIEYVMTVQFNEDNFPKSVITQYHEAIILRALTKLPMTYLADERVDYAGMYRSELMKVQRRVDSGGVYWVKTPPFWGENATRRESLGSGSYGLPL